MKIKQHILSALLIASLLFVSGCAAFEIPQSSPASSTADASAVSTEAGQSKTSEPLPTGLLLNSSQYIEVSNKDFYTPDIFSLFYPTKDIIASRSQNGLIILDENLNIKYQNPGMYPGDKYNVFYYANHFVNFYGLEIIAYDYQLNQIGKIDCPDGNNEQSFATKAGEGFVVDGAEYLTYYSEDLKQLAQLKKPVSLKDSIRQIDYTYIDGKNIYFFYTTAHTLYVYDYTAKTSKKIMEYAITIKDNHRGDVLLFASDKLYLYNIKTNSVGVALENMSLRDCGFFDDGETLYSFTHDRYLTTINTKTGEMKEFGQYELNNDSHYYFADSGKGYAVYQTRSDDGLFRLVWIDISNGAIKKIDVARGLDCNLEGVLPNGSMVFSVRHLEGENFIYKTYILKNS